MDLNKKRKADDNGGVNSGMPLFGNLSAADVEKILEPFTKEQLLPIVRAAILRHPDMLEAVRDVADADPVQRKLFVRGLGWESTTEKLREVFSVYGELDDANTIVIADKNTGKSKGYGFVTFKHMDAAILALKEPNKKIDGRITVTQLAALGNSGNSNSPDLASRKIYVGNIPFEISSERLLSHFSMYGEIEEGPLGFDKQTGKARGFAFFVYKTEEGANASLIDPMKIIDGHQLICKLATDNKKQKLNSVPANGTVMGMPNAGAVGMVTGAMPGPNYGVGGHPGYGQGANTPQHAQTGGAMHQHNGYNISVGGPAGQGYGTVYRGTSSQFGGGLGGNGSGAFGGGMNNTGNYRMQPSSVGRQSSGSYPDGGNYGLLAAYPPQPNQAGNVSGPRLSGYLDAPPYY